MKVVVALAAVAAILAGEARADALVTPLPGVNVTSIVSADANSAGQPIVFPQKNGHVTAALYEIQPGAALPVHKHPFPRLGYVVSGELQVINTETGKSQAYGPGSLVLEAVGQWHEGSNAGRVPLKLLVIDLSEKGAPTTIPKP